MALTIESALRKDKRTAQHCKAYGLQHRHFAFIAATLASCKPGTLPATTANGVHPYTTWREQVALWCTACAGSNPRFDRARFLRACGVE